MKFGCYACTLWTPAPARRFRHRAATRRAAMEPRGPVFGELRLGGRSPCIALAFRSTLPGEAVRCVSGPTGAGRRPRNGPAERASLVAGSLLARFAPFLPPGLHVVLLGTSLSGNSLELGATPRHLATEPSSATRPAFRLDARTGAASWVTIVLTRARSASGRPRGSLAVAAPPVPENAARPENKEQR